MRYINLILVIYALLIIFCGVGCANESPLGHWFTFDENTGDTLAIMEIYETKNGIAGKIDSLFLLPHQGKKGICTNCPGEKRNQPMIGLTFLENFEQKKDEWKNGKIMDPASGKTYKAKLWTTPEDELIIQVSAGPFGLVKKTRTWKRKPGAGVAGSPVGLWEIYHGYFNKVSAIVEVQINSGKLSAKIVDTFLMPDEGPNAICLSCPDSLKNQPIAGLNILSELTQKEDRWEGGRIFDPGNGKTYRCAIWLESKDRLKVRGYLGPFYRTQVWHRM